MIACTQTRGENGCRVCIFQKAPKHFGPRRPAILEAWSATDGRKSKGDGEDGGEERLVSFGCFLGRETGANRVEEGRTGLQTRAMIRAWNSLGVFNSSEISFTKQRPPSLYPLPPLSLLLASFFLVFKHL